MAGEPDSVFLPGEFEYKTKSKREVNGIEVTAGVKDNIRQIAKKYGVLLPDLD
jgi:LDH2 family malate/lactate/ureidoglycolate dehydrogenase